MYGTLVIGPLGMLFNIISLIIFVKLKFQKSPTGLHLLLFTVSETLMLVGVFMARTRSWVQYINIPIVARYHSAYCNILQFIVSSQLVWSSLLLVSATIERFLVIAFPFKVKSWNLLKLTKIIVIIYTIISFVLGIIGGVRKTVNQKGYPYRCKDDPKYKELALLTKTLTYTILGQGACPLLILIFTCLIAKKLHEQYLIRKNVLTEQENQGNKEFRVTIMLFITSCVFLFPRISQIVIYYIRAYTTFVEVLIILDILAKFLVTVSHSVNFLVYFCFFDHFRQIFLSWFSCKSASEDEPGTELVSSGPSSWTRTTDDNVSGSSRFGEREQRSTSVWNWHIFRRKERKKERKKERGNANLNKMEVLPIGIQYTAGVMQFQLL